MKHTRTVFTATVAIFALALIGCQPEPKPAPHVHQWGEWVVTTPATFTETGEETRTCALDATHTETRPIPMLLPITSVADLETWLTSQPANTAATAYTVKLNVNDLGGSFSTAGSAGKMLTDNSTKYVSLDLSGSTFTSIGGYAFTNCTSLTGVIIPNSVTSIGDRAFASTDSLTSVIIPNGVTSIEEWAFSGTGLTSVTIPDSVTSIELYAFSFSNSLAAINVNSGNTAYSSTDGVLYNKEKTLLHTYPAGKTGSTFTIPNSVTSIGQAAFEQCISLANVTIPNSITSIGSGAFQGCTSLASVIIPNSVTGMGGSVFYGCTSLDSVTIPNSVTLIGYLFFCGCTSLASINIPDSVTDIGVWAFAACTSLTSVRFERADTTFYTSTDSPSFIDTANSQSLQTAYTVGGIGTYTRPNTTSTTWSKQL